MDFETINNNSQEKKDLSNLPQWTRRIIKRAEELILQKDDKDFKTKAERLLKDETFINTIIPQEEWTEELSSEKADTDEKAATLEEKLAQDLVLLIEKYEG